MGDRIGHQISWPTGPDIDLIKNEKICTFFTRGYVQSWKGLLIGHVFNSMNDEEWMLLYGSRIHNVSVWDTVTPLILADKFPKRIHKIKIIISLSLRYRILLQYSRSCIQTFIKLILWHFLSSMRVKLV